MKHNLFTAVLLLLAIPSASAGLWDRGMDRLESGDYEGAAADLEAFARENPGDRNAPRALFLAGDLSEALGRDPQALDLYRRALDEYETGPWVLKCLDRLAPLHRKRKEWDAAENALVRFIEVYLETRKDTVAGPPVQEALDRIVDVRRAENPSLSREDILRSLVDEFSDHPIRDAVMVAEGGRFLPPGSNLLRNPGFEWDGQAQILPPVGWNYLGTEPNLDDDLDGTLNASVFDVGDPRSGEFCAGKFTSYGSHRGWLFQTIPVEKGGKYECFAFGHVRGESDAVGRIRIGVDPSGGTDPRAAAVLWTEYVSPLGDYEKIGFLGDDAVRSPGETLTLFLEIRQDDIRPDNSMLFDDVCVRLAGE
jgi:hypothetical protein